MDIETLDQKINLHFSGKVVRKDLTKAIKGNSVVPTYVLEYLLGQYCATDDEESIQSGIERVKKILAEHFVHRKESKLVQSNIREKGNHRVIDKVTVELNPSRDVYEATFMNLGLKKIKIGSDFARKHPKLLVGGIWCIVDLKYEATDEKGLQPWILEMLKPIQVSNFDDKQYLLARAEFETEEWLDFLMQSIGLNPEMLSHRAKLLQLIRLIPFCERNYNLIELGPKGTGKSHVFSEFSPHGILVSGGEITVAKLFVNNANAKVGLVGFWDSVAFDEFAGKEKRVDKNLVDIMKNYMANKSFSRGIDSVGAEASMSFLGNTKRNVAYMMRHTHFFEELPDKYIDSAFLDRLHCYLPGWDIPKMNQELTTDHFGLVSDFFSECLSHLRFQSRVSMMQNRVHLGGALSGRDTNSVNKTVSGLLKLMYPDPESSVSDEDLEWATRIALEVRRRVKEQQKRIGSAEFRNTHFSYFIGDDGVEQFVATPELRSDNEIGDDPLEPGQIWAISEGGSDIDDNAGLYRIEVNEGPGSGVKILNNPVPAAFKESMRYAEQNLYARSTQLIGDRDPRSHEFTVQLRSFDAAKKGSKLGVSALIAMCSSLLKKPIKGGLIVVGEINLGGSIEPIMNAVNIAELAVEKGASSLLMPVTARRMLYDLSDDMATKVDIQFYQDAKDALLKAIVE